MMNKGMKLKYLIRKYETTKMPVILLLLVLCVVPAFATEPIDRIVAIVDEDVILESEVFQYLQMNIGSQKAFESLPASKIDSMKKQILEELIKQKVILAKARADTIKVLPRDVDKELDGRIKSLSDQVGGNDKLEEYYGMPIARIKKQFRPVVEEGMMIEKAKAEKLRPIKISHLEVDKFWKTYQDSIPPLKDALRISHILLRDVLSEGSTQAAIKKADSAKALIESGKITFEEYASRYSNDEGTGAKGGKLGLTSRGDLVPEYESVAFNLKDGEISKPVVSSFGVHLIRMEGRVGEKINTSHILFKIVPAEEDKQQTMARADSIIQALKGGADFGDLALRYSTDAKTAPKGGDLGWFSPEELPEDFRAPLENLKKDDLTSPFRTKFGVHIVKVTERVFARKVSLEDDYDRIEQMALHMKQADEYDKWIAELSKEMYIERK
jgi:peptidyl-prolyl cis-trans isomerase SurA